MESDCYQHVKRCVKCQTYANNIHVAPSFLYNLTSPWPFSMWGLDVIELIEPKASNGHRFILVAVDYFTKGIEAASYPRVTRNMMIKHHNSTPYRPKMNGIVEAANKNIKKIVQKMVVTYKDWHEMLPYTLHGYRTSVRTSMGPTPYSLVYGMEVVLPIEVEISSLRVLAEVKLEDAKWIQNQLDQLNLIEEKRLTTLCHGQLYQKRIREAFDKKERPHIFKEEDLVLKKILLNTQDRRGKWAPN
ncbi:hypothetical protein CR513_25706, partial [Mucuna pruriens]